MNEFSVFCGWISAVAFFVLHFWNTKFIYIYFISYRLTQINKPEGMEVPTVA